MQQLPPINLKRSTVGNMFYDRTAYHADEKVQFNWWSTSAHLATYLLRLE